MLYILIDQHLEGQAKEGEILSSELCNSLTMYNYILMFLTCLDFHLVESGLIPTKLIII
jgi:hypothetical protein